MSPGSEADARACGKPAGNVASQPVASSISVRAPLRSDLGFRMGTVHRALRAGWEETLADLGVSPPQAAVLRAVSEGEACGLRALARGMGTDVMNVKRLVAHLEEAGLVHSSPDPEHSQRHIVRATPVGIAVSQEIAARAVATEQRLRSLLGGEDLDRLQELLAKLQAVLTDPGVAIHSGPMAGSPEHALERDI